MTVKELILLLEQYPEAMDYEILFDVMTVDDWNKEDTVSIDEVWVNWNMKEVELGVKK